jgi:hypothetical protein
MAMTIVEAPPGITGGVDTHLDTHVAAALDPLGWLVGTESFNADAAGYKALLAWLRATVLTIKWVDKNSAGTNIAHVVASTVSSSGFDILVNGLNEPGFDLAKDSGGTASATGSFTGTDSGASSESNVFAKKTLNQITTSCNSDSKYGTTDGLVTLPIGGVGTASDPSHALVS